MKKTRIGIAHEDERGRIVDVLTSTAIDAATVIECKPGAVRGNHYHKDTTQWTYVLDGSVAYVSVGPNGVREEVTLDKGDLVVTEPFESHAIQAIVESRILVLTKGPRNGGAYESDTFRLETPLVPRPVFTTPR